MADERKTDPDPQTEPGPGTPYKLEPSAEIAEAAAQPDKSEASEDGNAGEAAERPEAADPTESAGAQARRTPEEEPEAAGTGPAAARPGDDPASAAAAPQTRVVETVVEKRGGFGTALLAGLIAALLGFVAARSAILDPFLPDSLKRPDASAPLAALDGRLAEQSAALAALDGRVSGLDIPDVAQIEAAASAQISAVAEQLPPLGARIDALSGQLAELTDRLGPLETRLTDLEKRPIDQGVSEAAIAAYERELAALQAAMASQRAEIEAMVQNAQAMKAESDEMRVKAAAAASQAETVAAATRLQVAVEAGSPFAAELDALTSAGVDAPEILTRTAGEGVATLATLRASFPPAAREALAAARASDGGEGSVGAFLQRQLGIRSVEPRAGDDPDAVLSRAEAALTQGDLPAALTELSALPQVARDAMGQWIDLAQTRQDAIAAAGTLTESLNTN